MVGNFHGSNFLWFGGPDDFVGLYFRGVPNFSWISRVHEIHENLNLTEITNHTVPYTGNL